MDPDKDLTSLLRISIVDRELGYVVLYLGIYVGGNFEI